MTIKTSDIPATRQRAGARRAVDVVYGMVILLLSLWLAIKAWRRRRDTRTH